jgi:inner membrane protein
MVGKSHQLVGFTTVYAVGLLTYQPYLNTQTLIAALLCISLGSLTPDLDSQENKLYTLVPAGQRIVAEVGERLFGKHRSISHSLLGTVIIGFISHWLIYKIPGANNFNLDVLWYSYFISFLSHLAADAVTIEGIPLLWPIPFKFGIPPVKFLRMKTGGWFEIFIVRTLLAIFILYLTYRYWNELRVILGFKHLSAL